METVLVTPIKKVSRINNDSNTSTPWKLHFVKSSVTEPVSNVNVDSGFDTFVSELCDENALSSTLVLEDGNEENSLEDEISKLETTLQELDNSQDTIIVSEKPASDSSVIIVSPSAKSPNVSGTSHTSHVWKPSEISDNSFVILDETGEENTFGASNDSEIQILYSKTNGKTNDIRHTVQLKLDKPENTIVLVNENPTKTADRHIKDKEGKHEVNSKETEASSGLSEESKGTDKLCKENGETVSKLSISHEEKNKPYETNDTKYDSQKVVVGASGKDDNSEQLPAKHDSGDFVSIDPQENADNNDPEWQLLKKLETDEERYKAVRMRWRNLVIPNPNKNLTYRSRGYRMPKKENIQPVEQKTDVTLPSRKRTRSADPLAPHPPSKRQRTFSCTELFDRKLYDVEKNLRRARNNILRQHDMEVQNLLHKANSQLCCFPDDEQAIRMMHVQNVVELRRKYDNRLAAAESESMARLRELQKAMQEVRTFNSFYQGLEEGTEDTLLLTDEQLNEMLEEDHLYECFDKFYKE